MVYDDNGKVDLHGFFVPPIRLIFQKNYLVQGAFLAWVRISLITIALNQVDLSGTRSISEIPSCTSLTGGANKLFYAWNASMQIVNLNSFPPVLNNCESILNKWQGEKMVVRRLTLNLLKTAPCGDIFLLLLFEVVFLILFGLSICAVEPNCKHKMFHLVKLRLRLQRPGERCYHRRVS